MKRIFGDDPMSNDGGLRPVSSANQRKFPYKLMPFQKEGVEYITSRKYSLLADDMGL